MTWWDFLSDFIFILNDLFSLRLFEVMVNDGHYVSLTLGSLLSGIIIVCAVLFYFIPRR